MRISRGLKQAYDAQDLAYDALRSFREAHTDEESGKLGPLSKDDALMLSALIKSWETAQCRIDYHRGKPAPGSYKPLERKPQPHKGPVNYLEPSPGYGPLVMQDKPVQAAQAVQAVDVADDAANQAVDAGQAGPASAAAASVEPAPPTS